MFKKLLVANRGEIALRIIRACREMGVASVAVYSDVDRNALHVRQADEAYLLGAAPPRDSYLNIGKILSIARRCGAEAIHPGYGFLAENAAFAEACRKDGIVLVGPSPEAMHLMGDKLAARRTVREAGVPVVPGTETPVGKNEALAAARKVGYPVLIKAAAGGGGKGIRLVRSSQDVESALAVSSSEAVSAFGDGTVYVEKYLEPVRHVEVQVLGDSEGHVVALGERECSIQRRHQKLIEESPSTAVDEKLRRRMCDAAVAVTRAAGYHSAGTVEFLLDAEGHFYFLEMNTRLQVEHPVTEMVTGVDLVAEQIRMAAGGSLALPEEEIELSGWALECRIAAEDPFNDFMPSLGRVDYVSEPSGPGIRVDSALYAGVELPYQYDPMVAKVIAWGRTRDEAVQRMRRALGEFSVVGVETNIPFHLQVLSDERFLAGELSTTFLENFSMSGQARDGDERVALLAAALLTHLKRRRAPATAGAAPPVDGSAWRSAGRAASLRSGGRRGTGWRSIV